MHEYGYASDETTIGLLVALVALVVGLGVWRQYEVTPPRFLQTLLMAGCCVVVIGGSCKQGFYREAGWQAILHAAVLLNLFISIEIRREIRSRRRSAIPVAIVSSMCCRVARDGPHEPDHPALCSGRGGRGCKAV